MTTRPHNPPLSEAAIAELLDEGRGGGPGTILALAEEVMALRQTNAALLLACERALRECETLFPFRDRVLRAEEVLRTALAAATEPAAS